MHGWTYEICVQVCVHACIHEHLCVWMHTWTYVCIHRYAPPTRTTSSPSSPPPPHPPPRPPPPPQSHLESWASRAPRLATRRVWLAPAVSPRNHQGYCFWRRAARQVTAARMSRRARVGDHVQVRPGSDAATCLVCAHITFVRLRNACAVCVANLHVLPCLSLTYISLS